MKTIKFPKPDYKLWSKLETWSLNQAAFLLHGINPREIQGVRLGERDVPPEFAKIKETYFVLRSIPWGKSYPDDYFPQLGVRPLIIIAEAHARELPMPKPLYKVFADRLGTVKKSTEKPSKEEILKLVPSKKQTNNSLENEEKPYTKRERKNLLISLGLFVKLLEKFYEKTELSASQVAGMLKDIASELGTESVELGSFDRKITEALKLLAEESSSFK